MKIICDSCGTKYSISDDKVRGKVFKIRCKKCSHIIVVRGGEAAADAAAMTPPIEGGWHIVVDGEQVGPIPEADVRARIERGELKADTYTWKEGFTDWVKLSAVPEFSDLLVPAAAAPAAGELFAAPAASNGAEHAHHPSAPRASLFGNGAGEDVFSAPATAARSSGGDLFAAATATASSEPRWPTSGAAAAGHDGGRVESLTGQRHENSVLFSLANLQSLASANAPKPAPSAGLGAPAAEGSGLIDIRAMAASTLTSPAEGANGSHSEDLPAFGSFSPAAPVLLPIQSSTPKWVYPAVGIMMVLVGAIIFVAYKVGTAKSPLEPTQVLVPVPTPVPAPAEPAKTAAKAPSEAKPSTIPDDKLPPRANEPGGKSTEAKSEKSEHHHGKVAREKKVASAEEKKGASAPTPAEAEKKPAKGSIDALLLDAVPKGSRAARGGDDDSPRKSAGEGAAPLAKNAVVAGMNSVKGKVNDCYNQFKVPGMAMVNVVIGKNGRISSATVTGKFAGTPTGACVEKAVKTASFPPSSDGLSTPYPFNLK